MVMMNPKSNPVHKDKPSNKLPRFAHTANTKYGMGDFYGSGIKQKMGRVKDQYNPFGGQQTNRKIGTPPKNLA